MARRIGHLMRARLENGSQIFYSQTRLWSTCRALETSKSRDIFCTCIWRRGRVQFFQLFPRLYQPCKSNEESVLFDSKIDFQDFGRDMWFTDTITNPFIYFNFYPIIIFFKLIYIFFMATINKLV